jgi:hypothetical protein
MSYHLKESIRVVFGVLLITGSQQQPTSPPSAIYPNLAAIAN